MHHADPAKTPPSPRTAWAAWTRWLAPLAWMAAIYLVSDQPDIPKAPNGVLDWILKKTLHAAAYGILAWLLARALAVGMPVTWAQRARRAWLPMAWLVAVLYAVTDEIHQSFVIGRHGRAYDVVIDGTGALAALWWLYGRRRQQ